MWQVLVLVAASVGILACSSSGGGSPQPGADGGAQADSGASNDAGTGMDGGAGDDGGAGTDGGLGADGGVLATIELPRTGQITSHDPNGRDDGALQKGAAWPSPRFEIGTGAEADCVTDKLTGLVWAKALGASYVTWKNALAAASGSALCGFSDWRLPNVREIRSVIDYSKVASPLLPTGHPFTGVQVDADYWTSTGIDASSGYVLHIYTGGTGAPIPGTTAAKTWLVRAGPNGAAAGSWPANLAKTGQLSSYQVGDDGTLQHGVAWPNPRFEVGTGAQTGCVTDLLTGLTWIQAPGATHYDWASALAAVHGLNRCGFTDWRMPNVNEIESLIDYGQGDTSLWLKGQGFGTLDVTASYWTSTNSTNSAWTIDLQYGNISADDKSGSRPVLPVHGS